MFPLCQSMFRTTLGCSSRFTVLGSFLFPKLLLLFKEFSGFGSLFSYHCALCNQSQSDWLPTCEPFTKWIFMFAIPCLLLLFCYQRQLLYLNMSVIICQQLFYFFFKTFEFYFNFSHRSLTGQHWKIVVYSSFLSVSLSATNINISYLFYDVNIFF